MHEPTARKNPPEDIPIDSPCRRRLPPLLRRAWYGLNQTFRRRIAPLGLTPDQYTILRTLEEGGDEGMTQREIAALMCSDPNTISALLKRMQAAGLLELVPHERDRRAHRTRLIPAGRKAFLRARKEARLLQQRILAAVPEDKREEFLALLERVGDECQSALLEE